MRHYSQQNPELELVPQVLIVIQRATKLLERGMVKDDRALRDFLRSLRTAAYSISSIFRDQCDAGLEAKLVKYAVAILNAVESSVKVFAFFCFPKSPFEAAKRRSPSLSLCQP